MKAITNETVNQLTPREKQLVLLMCDGYSRSQIAEKMSMSIHTYDGYRKNIRQKLAIKNQVDWARLLHRVDATK